MTREIFKELFDKYFDEIRNYLYYRSGDADLATDLAQDAFLRIWEKRSKVFPGKERSMLYKIAGDLFVSHYRRNRLSFNYKCSLLLKMDDLSPEVILQYEELKSKYEKALASLPENQRLVFLMSRMDDMKYHEIAERLGLSIKAVEKRMSAALAYFRKRIDY